MKLEWLGIAEDITAGGVVGVSYGERSSPKGWATAPQPNAAPQGDFGRLLVVGLCVWGMYAFGHDVLNWLRTNYFGSTQVVQAAPARVGVVNTVPAPIIASKKVDLPARVGPVAEPEATKPSVTRRRKSGKSAGSKSQYTKEIVTNSADQSGGSANDTELDLDKYRALARGL